MPRNRYYRAHKTPIFATIPQPNPDPKPMKKNYRTKDQDMLIIALLICEHFKEHKKELTAIQSTWEDPFIENLQQRITNALENYIGKAIYKDLKIATLELNNHIEIAYHKLAILKAQIEMTFKNDPSQLAWLINTLGYDEYWKKVQNRAQEPTIAILYRIKTNLTPDINTLLTTHGIKRTIPQELANLADQIQQAEVTQETLKTRAIDLHAETRQEFNTIYQNIIAICTIGQKVFKTKPTLKTKFSFRKLHQNLHTKPQPTPTKK